MTATRRTKWLVVFGLLAAVAFCIALPALWIWPQFVYGRERSAGYEVVAQLVDRRPADVTPAVWEVATSSAITAYANVCFSDEHVPIDELRRFHADSKARLEGEVNLATIDWVWQRLGETGPHGRQYRDRFESQYRDRLNAALADPVNHVVGGSD
jgi:hypothetical protein